MKSLIRWRLRTMFLLITAIGIWFGLETGRIRHRRQVLTESVKMNYGQYPDFVGIRYEIDPKSTNGLAGLLGDFRITRIYAVNRPFRDNEEEELRAVFPEADFAANITNESLISEDDKHKLCISDGREDPLELLLSRLETEAFIAIDDWYYNTGQ